MYTFQHHLPKDSGSMDSLEVVLFDILEILVGSVLDFLRGSFIADDDAVGMFLQGTDGPPVGDRTFDGSLQSAALGMSITEYEHFTSIHDSANTHCECGGRHIFWTSAEEAAVGYARIGGEGLLTGAALQAAARLVEGDVTVGADAANKEVNATGFLDHLLVVGAFSSEILGVAIQDVDILAGDVNVIKEIGGHEAMIAFGMAFRQTNILVHVESENVLEGDTTRFVGLNEGTVHANRAAASRQAKDERFLCGGVGSVNLVNDVISCPLGHPIVVRFNDYSHNR